MVVYRILNVINLNQYIGSTVNFNKRKQLHIKRLQSNKHHSPYLQNAWNKYGEDVFKFEIIETVSSKEILIAREQYYIDNSNSVYNVCKIAGSSLGVKRRPETIDRVRQANLGLKHPEWRNKIKSEAQGGDNHRTKKKGFNDEAKKNMSEAHKRLRDNGYVSPVSKGVIEIDINGNIVNEWTSLAKAGLYYNVKGMTIKNIINGKRSNKLKHKQFKLK